METRLPRILFPDPFFNGRGEMFPHFIGHKKRPVNGPSEFFFCQYQFIRPQRFPVGRRLVLLVGTAESYVCPYRNKRWSFRFCTRLMDGVFDRFKIVAVRNFLNMPVVGSKPLASIFRKSDIRAAFNGNPVVVIKIDELTQSQMTRQGSGLMTHPFHQVPITDNAIGKMVDDIQSRPVKPGRQKLLRQGHPHPTRKPLTERSRRNFHPRSQTVFRVTGCSAPPLAESFQVVYGQVISCQVKQTVKKHGTMARGKDEPIPVLPFWVSGVVFQKPRPQDIGHGCRAHGHTGMA